MAVSLAELILLGLLADWVFRKFRMPGLVGMLFLGVVAGPYVLDIMSPGILDNSADLRLIALIVILLRAGFELSRDTLNRVGRMALLLSCIPAVFEGLAITALGPRLLGLTYMQSAILGTVLSAVSPAVVVPLMIRFMEKRMGATKGIPTLVLLVMGASILLVRVEHMFENVFPFAALLAVMAIGFLVLEKREHMAHEISAKLGKIWVFAEIILFTMVGAQVNVRVAWQAGLAGACLVFLGLIARSLGTYLCMLGSDLNLKERLFVVISYIPKATVQAAIGGAPLVAMKAAGMDTGPGEIILAVAVLSIVLTAPLGAWAIAFVGGRVLEVAPLDRHDVLDAIHESEGDYEILADGPEMS